MSEPTTKRSAVVVGASLAGLCTALALARAGWTITVLERSTRPLTGMGLAIDIDLLQSITGIGRDRVPTIDAGYSFTGWGLLHAALLTDASGHASISVQTGSTVQGVLNDSRNGGAVVQTVTGNIAAALVVGADGYNSVVRRTVAPDDSTSSYSGFVLWRGLIEENRLPRGFGGRVGLDLENASHDVLATFAIPAADGSTRPGQRRGVYTWFDASSTREIRTAGLIDGYSVTGTWHGQDVPSPVVSALTNRASRWSTPWRGAVAASVRDRRFIATPVAEYLPSRLAIGRVALVGDAAHVVSPVTGAGFHNALLDIQALARAVAGVPVEALPGALRRYDHQRLPLARALVSESRAWSDRFTAAG